MCISRKASPANLLVLVGVVLSALAVSPSVAQDPQTLGPPGSSRSSRGGPPSRGPGGPAEPGKEGDQSETSQGEDAAEKEKKDADAKEESKPPKVVRRDGLDLPEGDPAELKTVVGEDGKVGFRFRNQGWIDLIRWLSDISGQPIDWQELPGDAVNLVSPGRLSVADTIDLMNRHLLARGYTMLELEGGITIVKTDAINPGMVHWVAPSELQKLPNHTFVRTMLDAGWLSAEKLAQELAPMLSGAGKLTALATTNRIEAMDAAVNLREVARLLAEERDVASRNALAPEFRLRHIPAEEAKALLEEFLGVEKQEATPMTREQMQMMQRMQQQQGGKAPPAEKEVEISIVANVRQNSVLVRAPIDRVAIAAEFIKRIDVPGGSIQSLTDATSRVEVYRLVSLDPEKLIEIAQEMNVLEPTTRIRVDKDNKAVIVSGAAADRFIIKSLIERLDGGKRRFEVLQLRRLDAAAVAESISFLMGTDEDNEDNSRRSRYYRWGGDDENQDDDKFRVAANAGYRQVLLWANETEMEEVRSLLIKLGELPPPGGSGQTVRRIEASASPETLEYLKQLKAQWEAMSPNELVLPDADKFLDKDSDEDASETEPDSPGNRDDRENQAEPEPTGDETNVDGQPIVNAKRRDDTRRDRFGGDAVMLTSEQTNRTDSSESGESAPSKPAPVEIRLDSQGNLVLSSSDTKALDKLENLMLDIKPPTRSYEIFHIKNASVTLLTLDLEDYFKDPDDKSDDNSNRFYRWLFNDDSSSDKGPTGLAKSGQLRFLPNSDTGTIVVTGATSAQLQTIAELIELWDVAEPVNPKLSRFTSLVTIRYGRSEKIAETVKEAYRDLLSSNDKAFSSGGGGNNGSRRSSNRGQGTRLEDSDSGQSGGGSDFSFNGKLSIGVDELGNTLLVSAEGEPLLELIVSMIEKLDRASQPGGEIEIVQFSGNVSAETLRQAMSALGNTSMGVSSSNSNSDSRRTNFRGSDRRTDRGRGGERGGGRGRGGASSSSSNR